MKSTHPNTHSLAWVKENFNDFIRVIYTKKKLTKVQFFDGSVCFYDKDVKICTLQHYNYMQDLQSFFNECDETNTYNLCRCNNCDTIMYDENPSEESTQFTGKQIPDIVVSMVQCVDEDTEDGSFFWGCPVCKTDEYLKDL